MPVVELVEGGTGPRSKRTRRADGGADRDSPEGDGYGRLFAPGSDILSDDLRCIFGDED